MKKNKKRISRFIIALLTLTLYLSMSLSVNAAEKDTLAITEVNTSSEGQIQPRGSLSGYGSQYTSSKISGQFSFSVTGSWSPWAGCTVKFENFPNGTTIYYTLTNVNTGTSMFSRSFTISSNDLDDNNIPLANVSPGTYCLSWSLSNSNAGTIRCYVY